jgi:penicillin amidase
VNTVAADGGVRADGLHADVEIVLDALGVAHIRAGCAHDAFFAQGYVHARDRLWQMERDRRQAYGEWAEVAGPAAVAGDLLARRLAVRRLVARDLAALSGATRAMLEAYAAGVNAFVANTAWEALPAPFVRRGLTPKPWRPEDSLAVFAQRHLAMGGWEAKVWRAAMAAVHGVAAVARWYAPFALADSAILAPGSRVAPPATSQALVAAVARVLAEARRPDADASNSWAVAGARTHSGLPLLAGDPHRALDLPNVYHQIHIACPKFDAIGLAMPGVPALPHFGHNAAVAWAITHTGADTGDLYVERPEAMAVVWREVQSVAVRGAAPVAVEVAHTELGAVLDRGPDGVALSLRLPEWADVNPTFDAFLPLLGAQSVADAHEAMRPWVAPVQNLLCADRAGTIAYRTRGRLPVRAEANRYLPVPGDDATYRWRGYVAFDAMPRLANPHRGWIATANNRVHADPDGPYVATHFAPDHRARRLAQRLEAGRDLTVADMAAIHGDVVSLAAQDALALVGTVRAEGDVARRALSLVAEWDGTMAAERAAPLVYSAWRERLVRLVLADAAQTDSDLSPLATTGAAAMLALWRGRVFALARQGDRRPLPPGRAWPDLLSEAFTQAVDALAARFGPDPDAWRWGQAHTLPPGGAGGGENGEGEGPFGFPLPGDPDTVRAAAYQPDTGFVVQHGSVARYAFDLGDWDASAWVVPHGAGGDPGHPHYADQVAAWREARLLPMPYTHAAVERAAVERLRLRPD